MESEEENEPAVTISEFIENMDAQQLEVDLVLGGDEGKECTYEKGYIKRQAVFSCLTCTPAGNAGICAACSFHCHDGHEVAELWTRRNFRCDCGNEKFGTFDCKLYKDKEPQNEGNVYNQNYRGLYCTCRRPYPDPEGSDSAEMLQCCICEDWFHTSHLGLSSTQEIPRDDDGEALFEEIICQSCAKRCSFLSQYPELLLQPVELQDGDEDTPTLAEEGVDIPHSAMVNHSELEVLRPATKGEFVDASGSNSDSTYQTPCQNQQEDGSSYAGNVDTSAGGSSTGGALVCKLKQPNPACAGASEFETQEATNGVDKLVERQGSEPGQGLFLVKSWRSELCRCGNCMAMYTAKEAAFLLEREDTLQEYEETAKRKREELQEQQEGTARDFMRNLGHVQKMELVHGLNDMASELEAFLMPFGAAGKTVTSADIYEFFDKLQQKRRRMN